MDVFWFKVIAAIALLILIPCCGALPFLIANRVSANTRQVFLSLANAFAGGIFLGGGFVHLLADANKEFDNLLGDALHVQVGMVLAPVGLLFAFFVEKVLLKGHDHAHGAEPREGDGHGHGPASPATEPVHAEENGVALKELPVRPADEDSEPKNDEKKRLNDADSTSLDSSHRGAAPRPGAAAEEAPNELLPYLLAFVLSIHSIIGGMALGIQSSPAKVTPLFIAILSHKWIEAFALGASILKNSANFKSFVKIIVFYSLTSPLGIVLGIVLDTALQGVWAGGVITAVLTALAAGSFIYVAIVDILVEEFSNSRLKWLKLMLCICGLVFNTIISVMFEED